MQGESAYPWVETVNDTEVQYWDIDQIFCSLFNFSRQVAVTNSFFAPNIKA